jgi:hypothetical protein
MNNERAIKMKSKAYMVIGMALCVGLLAGVSMAWASTRANVPESWDVGLQNWESVRIDGMSATVQNSSGAISIMFGAQNGSAFGNPDNTVFRAGATASQGMFYGNLGGIGARGVQFTITGVGATVSWIALTLSNSVSHHVWTCKIDTLPQPGESLQIEKMFTVADGWYREDYVRDDSLLLDDLSSVSLLAIDICRGGGAAHGCLVDNFELIGPYMAGTAAYNGEQQGDTIRVVADGDQQPAPSAATIQGVAGSYTIADAPAPGTYTLTGYLDVNGNGVCDFWEPQGQYAGGSILLNQIVEQADIALTDPMNGNIPYWWLAQKLGVTSKTQADSKTAAEWIQDYGQTEFVVNSIQRDEGKCTLTWDYIPGVQLQVIGASDLASGFNPIGASFASENTTGDGKTVVEVDDTGATYFKVKIVQ